MRIPSTLKCKNLRHNVVLRQFSNESSKRLVKEMDRDDQCYNRITPVCMDCSSEAAWEATLSRWQ